MTSLSLEEKLGQLFVVGFDGKKVPKEMKQFITDYHIGGIILFARNIGTPEEVLALTTELQQIAYEANQAYPLLICVDQENGIVRRIGEGTTILPGAMATAATGDVRNAFELGVICGEELKALGINWNLAPVLDVNNNRDNPVIGVRSFGEKPEQVAAFGKETMKGLQKAGMVTTLKHFPGHGDTNVDSHLGMPQIEHSLERLEQIELLPFKECIQAGADTVMSAHIHFPALEPNEEIPATLSKNVITGLLREKLGFNGVVTTDCLEMDAIAKTVGTEQGAVAAIKAGIDVVMISHRLEKQKGAMDEIKKALANGEIREAQIDAAYDRIIELKKKYTSWEQLDLASEQSVSKIVGSKEHEEKALNVYQKSVTLEKGEAQLPLQKEQKRLVIEPQNTILTKAEDKQYAHSALGLAIREYATNADVISLPISLEQLVQAVAPYEQVIIGLVSASIDEAQVKVVQTLIDLGKSVIVVAMRSPYDINALPNEIDVYLNTYELSYPALSTAAAILFGELEPVGKAPVTVKKAFI
ncbi:beta-N-acetylhexosaminidase [Alkalihalobacillus alcalophilus ATCC 27647 = CGMCC 1.3604]|uniref:beta-N-acetylhexosaminidase n=1 Tax=Alkalihalobacillus alcalophilus ATCC 27647 = CGMCC 1.3604 TaxID=1218173 RepID=A0A094WMK8_ALKAL|nr:beta-N-acetylhexosaminidase [Alkalihalobacillus alcalophilus]KGA98999.1 beta-N-acetylhexosaminidase [Alkalihalobacillus alcalophilus ATCC 27647 = CGMCC 1.3604]MED1560635.1 beta-N-acetylhexosaminidase [Alkalihalobacillus alcalophilus]THG88360.1 beta-N-acetylhexosaminidase [Alkalihalobacillus alcalophilus ATCC 27647 = CGMCC 1.3604]